MADEAKTEATLPDAVSAGAGLFGDAEVAAIAEGVADENTVGETAEDRHETQNGEAVEASPDDAGEQPATAEELKMVMSIRDGRAIVGVQRTGADPHIEAFEDRDVPALAREVTAVVERARARWQESPKYPAHTRPAPAKAAATAKRRQRNEQGRRRRGRTAATSCAAALLGGALLRAESDMAGGRQCVRPPAIRHEKLCGALLLVG